MRPRAARPREAPGLEARAAAPPQASVSRAAGRRRPTLLPPPGPASLFPKVGEPGLRASPPPSPREPSPIPAAITGLLPHLRLVSVHLRARPAPRTSAWRRPPGCVRRDAGRGLRAGEGGEGRGGMPRRGGGVPGEGGGVPGEGGGATVFGQPIRTRGASPAPPRGAAARAGSPGAPQGPELGLAAPRSCIGKLLRQPVAKAKREAEDENEWTSGTRVPGPSRAGSQIRRELREAAALCLPHRAL